MTFTGAYLHDSPRRRIERVAAHLRRRGEVSLAGDDLAMAEELEQAAEELRAEARVVFYDDEGGRSDA